MAPPKETNKFDQLVTDLCKGDMNHNLIQIAYRTWVRRSDKIPDEIKDLLSGAERFGGQDAGLLYPMFQQINRIIGSLELAYRRGYQAGQEDAKKGGVA